MRALKVLGTFCLCVLSAAGCGARTSLIEDLNGAGQGGAASSTTQGSSTSSSTSVGGEGGCSDAILAHDAAGASALAIDGDDVFWGTVDGQVWKRESGGTPTQLAAAASTIGAFDIDANTVYYIDVTTLKRVSRGGGVPLPIPTEPLQAAILKVDSQAVYVLDAAGGLISGRVVRVPFGGGLEELITGLDTSFGMAIDDDNVYVESQFAQVNGQGLQGVLLSVPKTGGPVTVLAQNLSNPQGLVVFGDNLYLLEQTGPNGQGGGVRRISKLGGPLDTVASTSGYFPLDLAVDESGVYVTTLLEPPSGSGILLHMGLDGSGITTLASTQGVQFGAVRTNPSSVFWSIAWTAPPPGAASVRKQCK